MGYRIHCDSGKSTFKIPESKAAAAVALLMRARGAYKTVEAEVKNIKYFNRLPPSVQLTQIVNHTWGFVLELPDDEEGGDINGISFEWEKGTGEEDNLFKLLAPYVEAGSVVYMYGEGGENWRYLFDGTGVKLQTPKMEWVDSPEKE